MSLYSRLESLECKLNAEKLATTSAIALLREEGYQTDARNTKPKPTFDEAKKDIIKDYENNVYFQRFQNGETIDAFVKELVDEMTLPKYWVMHYSKPKYGAYKSKVNELIEIIPRSKVFKHIDAGNNYFKWFLFTVTVMPTFFMGLVWFSNKVSTDPPIKYGPEKFACSDIAMIWGVLALFGGVISQNLTPIIPYLRDHNYFKKRKAISQAKEYDKQLREWIN